ncbi:MAG: LysR family transcriptional regulator [Gammaproteobacteria bacterium]|nr:LysR family transcriptional regulator [Gammaproteobacteria bacterium]
MKSILKNINILHSFECAARHQSYSKAAAELCISQAAVSQQMRQLEAAVGSQLFLRKNKQMLLTQQGQTLFYASKQAFSILKKSLNEIKNEGVAGSLTITSTQAFTSLWLMPKLHKFLAQHPEIKIRVLSSAGFDDLKQQHIDLAIRFCANVKESTDAEYVCEYFGEDPVYPVCSPQLADTQNFHAPADLLQTWLVSLENPGAYDWASWFESAGVKAYREHQQWTHVHSTDMALNAVLSGHGFTLAARYLCIEQLESGQLMIPVNIPHPNVVKRYLVFDANTVKIARLKIFTDWLKSEMEVQTPAATLMTQSGLG